MDKQQKQEFVKLYHDRLQDAKAAILTDFKGLTVEEISAFRNELRKVADAEYRVVKNTLTILAAKGTAVEGLTEFMQGPTGIVLSFGDPVAPAKTVVEFSKKNDKLTIKAGMVEGQLVDPEALKSLASLPGRDQLLSNLAAGMQAPSSKMARLLSATISRFGYALTALSEKKEKAA